MASTDVGLSAPIGTPGARSTAVAAIAGPLLLLATTVAYAVNGEGFSEGSVAGAMQVWAFIVYGIGVIGLARLLEEDAPRAAEATTLLGVIGSVGGAAYGIDAIGLSVFGNTIAGTPAAPVALRIPGLAFPLALLVLGWFLARTRSVPPGAGYALAGAAVLFPIAHIGDLIIIGLVGDVVGVLAMGAIALSVFVRRDPVSDKAPAVPARETSRP